MLETCRELKETYTKKNWASSWSLKRIFTLIVINSTIIPIYLAITSWVHLTKQYEYFGFISAGSKSRNYQRQAATLMIVIKEHALQNSVMLPTSKSRLRRNSSCAKNMCQNLVPIFSILKLKKNVVYPYNM